MNVQTLLFTLSVIAFSNLALASQGHILVIHSYDSSLAWTRECEQGLREVLEPGYNVNSIYMATKTLPEKEFQQQTERAWKTFTDTKPDLVILGDDNALRLLGPKIATTPTPLVYFGINNNPRTYFETLPPTMAGVLERTPLIPWIRHLHDIRPKASRALVLFDSSETSDAIIADTFQRRKSLQINTINATYTIAQNWAEWQNIVRNAATKFDMLITPTFHTVHDENGKALDVDTVIAWTAATSAIPFFTNQDYTVHDHGAVGAYTLHGKTHGKMAADIAREILRDNRQPSAIGHRTDKTGHFHFNQKNLDRYGITLPEIIRTQTIFQ